MHENFAAEVDRKAVSTRPGLQYDLRRSQYPGFILRERRSPFFVESLSRILRHPRKEKGWYYRRQTLSQINELQIFSIYFETYIAELCRHVVYRCILC